MNGYLSDRVQVTLIYLPFQSPANPKPEGSYRFTETTYQDQASPECRWVPILGGIGRLLRGKSRR